MGLRKLLILVSLLVAPIGMAHAADASAIGAISDGVVATAAFKVLYGQTQTTRSETESGSPAVLWKSSQEQDSKLFPDGFGTGEVESTAFMVLPIEWSNRPAFLVMTESIPHPVKKDDYTYGCHACAPALGGAIIRYNHGTWNVIAKSIFVDNIGSWGQIPQGEVILLGAGHIGIRFDLDHIGQGNTDEGIVIVAVVGDGLSTVLDIPTGSSDMGGTCADEEADAKENGKKYNPKEWCYEYSSDISYSMRTGKDYYDIVVNYAGTNMDSNAKNSNGLTIVDVTRTETYGFNGKKYELTKVVKKSPLEPSELHMQ